MALDRKSKLLSMKMPKKNMEDELDLDTLPEEEEPMEEDLDMEEDMEEEYPMDEEEMIQALEKMGYKVQKPEEDMEEEELEDEEL